MRLQPHAKLALCFLLTFVMIIHPMPPRSHAAPQERANPGQGTVNRDDPCDQLPDPPGKANGIDKQCPAGGSSSGVAKGEGQALVDLNGKQRTIDTYSAQTVHRRVVWTGRLYRGTNYLSVSNLATPGRPRIDIDAVMVAEGNYCC